MIIRQTTFLFFLLITFSLQAQQLLIEEQVSLTNNWLSHFDKEEVQFDYEDKDRVRWSNLPVHVHPRQGVSLENMNDEQKRATQLMLQSVLSESGYLKINWVLWLDERRKEEMVIEGSDVYQHYGHNKYWMSVFGEPNAQDNWSWRLEGHHLSLNMTYKNGRVHITPFFIGAHPTVVLDGPFSGFEAMHVETKYGRKLYDSLTEKQKMEAVEANRAHDDILTRTGQEIHIQKPTGIMVKSLSKAQQAFVRVIVRTYFGNFDTEIAAPYLTNKEFATMRFSWAGTDNYEDGIYYRLQTKNWLIEYDHRQQNIEHIHSVIYDLKAAFGGK